VAALIPTVERPGRLRRVFDDLLAQTAQVDEAVIVDASVSAVTEQLCASYAPRFEGRLRYVRATTRGAAAQRNQGLTIVTAPFVLFMDDDVELPSDCIARLWRLFDRDTENHWGGVSSMIMNQRYEPPGRLSRWLFDVISGESAVSYAGRCIGPAVNLLPEDNPSLPEYVPVEWLNTTCTLYRRAALPTPAFSGHFDGYSLCEDLDLSLVVGRSWKLANARMARIVHNSGPGPGKPGDAEMARMELVNRHYVMTETLGRSSLRDYAKLALVETFLLLSTLAMGGGVRRFPARSWGKIRGLVEITGGRMQRSAHFKGQPEMTERRR